jgi:hypothetical protein
MGEDGLGLHEDLEYTVYAPGADDNRVEVFFGDGESEECELNDDEDDEEEYGRGEGWHSYHEEDWPEYEGEEPGPHSYVMYARAWFDGVEVYSDPVSVPVYVDPEKALTGEVNYRVLNDRAPRDGMFRVEVDPVDDAEFYEAFSTIESDRDANGKSLKNVRKKVIKHLVDAGWPEQYANEMYNLFNTDDKNKLNDWSW